MTRRTIPVRWLVSVVALALSTTGGGAQQPQFTGADFIPNEVIVQFAEGASPAAKAAARARVGGATSDIVRPNLEVLRIPPGLAVAAAVRNLQGDRAVTFAEPNWIYTHGSVSNDPYVT